MSVNLLILLQLQIIQLLPVCDSKGGRVRTPSVGIYTEDDVANLENYDYWDQGKIPLYIWVIGGLVTVLSLGIAVCTECCPGAWHSQKLKNLMNRRSCARTEVGKTNEPRPLRMLSISSDEFVVPLKN